MFIKIDFYSEMRKIFLCSRAKSQGCANRCRGELIVDKFFNNLWQTGFNKSVASSSSSWEKPINSRTEFFNQFDKLIKELVSQNKFVNFGFFFS
jgi:hypothetical protein